MSKKRTPTARAAKAQILPIAVDPGVIDTFVRRELRAMSPAARDGLAALRRVLPDLKLRDLDPYLAEFRVDGANG